MAIPPEYYNPEETCRDPSLKVVPLKKSPSVNDIPGQLRQMADLIESGKVAAYSAIFILPRENDWPEVYGWGDHLGDLGNVGLMEITKTWFVNNQACRNSGE